MTGKYPHSVGVWHTVRGRERLREDETTMADVFSANGYVTGIFGKWHLGDEYPFRPCDRGFTESVIHKGGAVSQAADYWGNDRMNDTYYHNEIPEKYEGFSSDVFIDNAMQFIARHKRDKFFVYIPTSVPHGPINILPEWSGKYYEKGCPEDPADFYASIEQVDQKIGELRAFLREHDLEENTLLFFFTDNGTSGGESVYNANMRGHKGSAYEGGHRVPCFLYWPADNLMLNREISEITSVMDLLPTFIEICDLELEKPVRFHGQSLKPLLFPGAGKWENRSILVETQRVITPIKWRNSVVMNKKWRLINGKELYDMERDFSQKNDVAVQFPEIVEGLRNDYQEIWTDISRRDDVYSRPVIGTEFAPVTTLSGMDWYDFIVSQQNVRKATISNGSWLIRIAEPGEYMFELRRWPRESQLSLGASTPEVKSTDNDIAFKKWGGKPAGKALDIYKAKIRVNDIELEKEADLSKDRVEFRVELDAGDAELKTWFYTTAGDTLGAYYVDIYNPDVMLEVQN
jgi:arylsulfatase A-like enzyme